MMHYLMKFLPQQSFNSKAYEQQQIMRCKPIMINLVNACFAQHTVTSQTYKITFTFLTVTFFQLTTL